MNRSKPSQCPVCRRCYIHFPRVCQLLHFFLMKAWPEDYKRKANEIQALEESTKIFSPRILSNPLSPSPSSCDQPHLTGTLNIILNHCPIFPEVEVTKAEKLLPMTTTLQQQSAAQEQIISFVDHHSEQSTTDSKQHEIASLIAANELTTEDLSCICCRKLLYRPVVLNCGEVLCESCCAETRLAHPGSNPTCPSCRSIHPSGPLGVCLALHHYLERAFPPLYSQRKEEIELQSKQCHATPLICHVAPAVDPDVDDKRCLVHIGAGCDGCGMFPIVGHRYHCRECGEQVGYDLCGSCYNNATTSNTGSATVDHNNAVTTSNTGSANYHSPVGRFNQQHSLEHRMEEMASDRRFAAVHFNAIVDLLHVAPLNLNLENGIISRRRQQQILDDFDDYIDTLV